MKNAAYLFFRARDATSRRDIPNALTEPERSPIAPTNYHATAHIHPCSTSLHGSAVVA
eukprot:COSAG02_NODE_12550_length_1527_cov_1.086134_1_plen_57_part_10